MHWFEYSGDRRDVVLSSRVRLARNIVDYPFGENLDKTGAAEIGERVKRAFSEGEGYRFTEFSALAENERSAYVEKSLASPDMIGAKLFSAIVENKEKGLAVLVGEEDHIRIQAIKAGLDLEGALAAALEADSLIEKREKIAFSKELGYLTHCPTNLGTGMRASVMLFLPLLTETGRMRGMDAHLQKIGLTLRGASGEGSAPEGCLYQVSNRITLGVTEEEIIKRIGEAAESLAAAERELWEKHRKDEALEDRIWRSYGIMKYARSVDTGELNRLYSDVRLGICLGHIDIDPAALDRLRIECMRGGLCLEAGRDLSARERDRKRADKLRSFEP